MARPKRILFEGAVYHVTTRGNARQPIYFSDNDRRIFLRILRETLAEEKVVCHAWVLMDNHYHLLLETPLANLSRALKRLNGLYTHKVNFEHKRVGHLFQGRYKSILVEKDSYLKELCRYIVLNPVRAGLVKQPGDYPWSSYRATAYPSTKQDWLEVRWILGQFGKTLGSARSGYRRFVKDGIKRNESPLGKVTSQVYLGNRGFLDEMESRLEGVSGVEIPSYQRKLTRPKPEQVLDRVAHEFKTTTVEILRPRMHGNEGGPVAAYLLGHEAGLSLSEIGALMGVTHSAVGNKITRLKKRLADDPALAKRIEKCKVYA